MVPNHNHGGRFKISARNEIHIFTWYIANTVTFRQLSNLFGISKSSAWKVVVRVSSWLVTISHNYIKWPVEEEMVIQSAKFEQRKGIPGVIGAIDGTHIRINAPKNNKRCYFNRKKYYSLQMQAIVNADMMFMDLHCGEPGSLHDSRILRRSLIFRNATLHERRLFPNNKFIIGDSAYPTKNWLVTPFKDNGHLTEQQTRFNFIHSSTRMVVENAFGLLKGRFRRLQFFTENRNLNLISNLIVSACVLHNMCIMAQDDYDVDSDDAILIETVAADNNTDIEFNQNATRRQTLINELVVRNVLRI